MPGPALAAALALACAGRADADPAPSAPPAATKAPAVTETIDETTVGFLGDARVPMGNVSTGTYALPDGTERSGDVCTLALPGDTHQVVGAGSVVTVDGQKWTVVKVHNPPQGLGSVTLKATD